MGYAELIEILQSLSQGKRAEVFDFVEFLVAKSKAARTTQHEPNGHGILFADIDMPVPLTSAPRFALPSRLRARRQTNRYASFTITNGRTASLPSSPCARR